MKFPSKSVIAPLEVPFSTTLAPGSGILVPASKIVPETVLCAITTTENSNATVNIKKRVVLFIIICLKLVDAKVHIYWH